MRPTYFPILLLCGAPLLAGCTDGNPKVQSAEQTILTSCRQHADEVYVKQNRAILSERDTKDSPFASTGLIGITSAGLGDRYGRDQMVDDCVQQNHGGRPSPNGTAVIDTTAAPRATPSATAPRSSGQAE